MARGGKREGAGRKKGPSRLAREATQAQRQQEQWTKDAARTFVMQRVCRELAPLVDAQIEHAKGLKYLVTRDTKTGKFIRVGPAIAANTNEETIEVWEKDPSVQAFTDLMNRALDKPKEQEQEIVVTGELELVQRLQGARKRLQQHRAGS